MTVPDGEMEPPAPALAMMVSLWREKVAVTEVLEFIVTVQEELPAQAPDHLPNVELAAGVAIRVTTVPELKVVPAGLLLTVPVPVPDLLMLNVY